MPELVNCNLFNSLDVLEALRGLQLSLLQRIVLLHLIHTKSPASFTELLQVSGSTPETLVIQLRRLYQAGYVRRLSARGTTDPVFEFIATTANREDVKSQIEKE